MVNIDENQQQWQSIAPGEPPFALDNIEKLFVVGDRRQGTFRAQALHLQAGRFQFSGPHFERLVK